MVSYKLLAKSSKSQVCVHRYTTATCTHMYCEYYRYVFMYILYLPSCLLRVSHIHTYMQYMFQLNSQLYAWALSRVIIMNIHLFQ